MSENASDCTQNAAYQDRKLKNFLGIRQSPLPRPSPIGEGDTPAPTPPFPRRRALRRLDSRAHDFGARPAAPPLSSFAPLPHLTLLATGLFIKSFFVVQQQHFFLPCRRVYERAGLYIQYLYKLLDKTNSIISLAHTASAGRMSYCHGELSVRQHFT